MSSENNSSESQGGLLGGVTGLVGGVVGMGLVLSSLECR